METITTRDELKTAIQDLEYENQFRKEQLKEQFNFTIESLKPINLIKNSLNKMVSSPKISDNILGIAMGVTSGYISKKIVLGRSVNIVRKLFSTLLQFGITKVVSQNSESIKTFGQSVYQFFRRKKE